MYFLSTISRSFAAQETDEALIDNPNRALAAKKCQPFLAVAPSVFWAAALVQRGVA
jgi:hypothetical protein